VKPLTVTRAPVLEHVEQSGDARERAGRCLLGHRTGVRPPPVRRPPSGGRTSHGVTGCRLQLYSRSHPARRSLLPGHPAGTAIWLFEAGEVLDEKGEAYETRSQVPCPWRRGRLARRRGAGPAGTLKCPPDSVKVGNASASCSSGRRRSRTTPSSLCSSPRPHCVAPCGIGSEEQRRLDLTYAAVDDTAGRRRIHERQVLLLGGRALLHAKHRGAVAAPHQAEAQVLQVEVRVPPRGGLGAPRPRPPWTPLPRA